MNNVRINQYLQNLIDSKQSYSEIFDHIENNKLSLYFVLNEKMFSSLVNSKDYRNFKKRVIYEKRKSDKTFKLIRKLNSYDIMVLKLFRDIPALNNDVDILIKNEADTKQIQDILLSNGYIQKKVSKIFFWNNCNEPYKQIWINEEDTANIIHLHQEVAWGGVIYFDKEDLFEKPDNIRAGNQEYLIPNNMYDFLINICHIFYEKNKIIFLEDLYLNGLKSNIDGHLLCPISKQHNFSYALHVFKQMQIVNEYPCTIKAIDFLALRIRKFIRDLLSLKLKQNFMELRAYTIDFASFFIFKRLRKLGVIK